MKISELNTKSFLGNAGAAANSYVLINYQDNTTNEPVTYKASLQELGQAIANDQKLYKKTQDGAITTTTENGAYVNTEAENFASVGYVNIKTDDIITSSNIGLFTMGFASTGYVTSAINTAKNNLASVGYVENRFYGIASEGYVTSAVSGLASENYVTEVLEEAGGFSPLESVTCSVIMEASASEASSLSVYPIMGDRNGNIFSIYGDSSTELMIRDDIATTAKITSAVNGLASTGYVTSAINTATSGLASTGALSTKASIGYVKYGTGRKIFEQNNKYVLKGHADASDPIDLTAAVLEADCSIARTKYFPIGAYIDPNDNDATLYRYNPTAREMQALQLNENNISNAISGLASTGYVTSATADMVTRNYLMSSQQIKSELIPGYSNLATKTYVDDAISTGISDLVSTGYVDEAISGLASTGYVTAAVANAGGGGFDPAESISCEFIPYGAGTSDPIEGNLYPVMMNRDAFYIGGGNGTMDPFIPLDKMLFYEIDTESNTLILKDRQDQEIYSIQLN